MDKSHIKRTDWLALERTRLANERTFLAYFRTFVVVLGSGLAIIKIESLAHMTDLGYFFCGLAVFIFLMGAIRYFLSKRRIKRYFEIGEQQDS